MPELRVIPRRELRRGATVYENIPVLSYSVGSPHQDSSYGEVNRQFSLENQCLRPMIFGPLAQTRIRKQFQNSILSVCKLAYSVVSTVPTKDVNPSGLPSLLTGDVPSAYLRNVNHPQE